MKRQLSTIMSLSLLLAMAHAQMNIGQQNAKPATPEWKMYEFQKYGKIGASLYTGTVNYSIPVFTYKDKDFELPVAITYSTNGFRTNHKSGILGHGWSLSVGGMITREIKGIPDEMSVATGIENGKFDSHTFYGYKFIDGGFDSFEVVPLNTTSQTVMPGGIRKEGSEIVYYETEPDIYSFNFLGYRGCFERKFECGENGFRLFNLADNSKGLKVDVVADDFISMVDEKGYIYGFTKVSSSTRGSLGFSEGPQTNSYNEGVVLGWHLNNIVAPNGRFIKFNISPVTNDYNYSVATSYYEAMLTNAQGTISKDVRTNRQCDSYHIDSISFCNDTEVLFLYEEGKREFALDFRGNKKNALGDCRRIAEIRVIKNGKVVKTCTFEYFSMDDNNGMSNPITFLKAVTISGEGRFTFGYDMSCNAPMLSTGSTDGFGYYNGSGAWIERFINSISYNGNDYTERYEPSIVSPNHRYASLGVLERIDYPTGGHSLLSYEPHDYSKMMERSERNQYEPELTIIKGKERTGGLRIKRIVTFSDELITTDTVDYDYSDESDFSLSSGVLLDTPRYGVQYTANGNGGTKTVRYYNGQSKIFDCGFTHIEYAHVTERRTNAGMTEYFYTTASQHPDYINLCESDEVYPVPTVAYDEKGEQMTVRYYSNTSPVLRNILSPVCSRQFMRGRLCKTAYRDADGKLLKTVTEDFEFPTVGNDTVLYVTGERANWFVFNRVNVSNASTTTSMYSDNTESISIESYTYNEHGRIATVSNMESDGSMTRIVNEYIGDRTAENDIQKAMVESNVLDCLKERRVYRNNNLTLAERYFYCMPDTRKKAMTKPDKVERRTADNGWKLLASYKYDSMGNIVEALTPDSVATAFLWSYGGQRLVAEIMGCRFNEVDKVLSDIGIVSTSSLTSMPTPSDGTLESLAMLQTKLPFAQTTLYRYEPRHRLKEIIQPNGLRSFFSYDGYGRLVATRDNNNAVTAKYEYRLATVTPPSVSLNFSNTQYILRDATFRADISGGTGEYEINWKISDRNGNVLMRHEGKDMTYTINIGAGTFIAYEDYIVECSVRDITSEETALATGSFRVENTPIEFTCIKQSFDYANGYGKTSARIDTSEPTALTFSLRCQTTGTCVVTIDGKTYSYSGHKEDVLIKQKIYKPWAEVSVEIRDAIAESTAELTVQSAECLTVGPSNILVVEL